MQISYGKKGVSRACSKENLDRAVERDLQKPKRSFLIAELDNKIVGYAQTSQVDAEEHELLRVYVRPEHHNKGIGKFTGGTPMWVIQILTLVLTLVLLVIGNKNKNKLFIRLGFLCCILLLASAAPEFVVC